MLQLDDTYKKLIEEINSIMTSSVNILILKEKIKNENIKKFCCTCAESIRIHSIDMSTNVNIELCNEIAKNEELVNNI